MTGDDRQRHCAACQRDIVDMSTMTETQAHAHVSERLANREELCVLFRQSDGRLKFAPEQVSKPRQAIAAAALTLGLSVGCDSRQAETPSAVEVQKETEPTAAPGASAAPTPKTTPAPTRLVPASELPDECETIDPKRLAELEKRDQHAAYVKSRLFRLDVDESEYEDLKYEEKAIYEPTTVRNAIKDLHVLQAKRNKRNRPKNEQRIILGLMKSPGDPRY